MNVPVYMRHRIHGVLKNSTHRNKRFVLHDWKHGLRQRH